MTLCKQSRHQQDTLPQQIASTAIFSLLLTRKAGTSQRSSFRQAGGITWGGPMGLSATSDDWCRKSDFVIEGNEIARKIVDDILCW
jgi:hypothetical protein